MARDKAGRFESTRFCPKGHDKDALPRTSNGGCRFCYRARSSKYAASAKGRANFAKYDATPKGKATRWRAWHSEKGIDNRKKHSYAESSKTRRRHMIWGYTARYSRRTSTEDKLKEDKLNGL